MLPMALTIAMAAAFFAAGRGIVLEIQARITKPEAKPTGAHVSLATPCQISQGIQLLTSHEEHGHVSRSSGRSRHRDDVSSDTRQGWDEVVEEALSSFISMPGVRKSNQDGEHPRRGSQQQRYRCAVS